MRFEEAFRLLIGHEGGYANDPNDPGGETKYGISKRSYPHLNIAELTMVDAQQIYRRDFWGACNCSALPDWVRFDVFDAAVNSGPTQAGKWLQFAVGATQDGVIGRETINKTVASNPRMTLMRMAAARMMFMAKLKNFKHHGKGWMIRMAKNIYHGASRGD